MTDPPHVDVDALLRAGSSTKRLEGGDRLRPLFLRAAPLGQAGAKKCVVEIELDESL